MARLFRALKWFPSVVHGYETTSLEHQSLILPVMDQENPSRCTITINSSRLDRSIMVSNRVINDRCVNYSNSGNHASAFPEPWQESPVSTVAVEEEMYVRVCFQGGGEIWWIVAFTPVKWLTCHKPNKEDRHFSSPLHFPVNQPGPDRRPVFITSSSVLRSPSLNQLSSPADVWAGAKCYTVSDMRYKNLLYVLDWSI